MKYYCANRVRDAKSIRGDGTSLCLRELVNGRCPIHGTKVNA